MKTKSKLFVSLLLAISFAYGFTVGNYKVFPYRTLKELTSSVPKNKSTTPAPNPNYRSRIFYSTLSNFKSTDTQPDIIMLGDSITQAGLWNEYLPAYKTANRGIGGDTTYGILERIEEITQRDAKFVFLLIGINDFDQHYTDKEIVDNILRIATTIKDSGSTPIIQSILYVSDLDKSKRSNQQIAKINNSIAETSKSLEIDFLDITSITENGKWLANDGLHLTGPAYVNWVRILTEFLDSH